MYSFVVHKVKGQDEPENWQDLILHYPGVVVIDQDENTMNVQATYEMMEQLKTEFRIDYFKYPPDPCLLGFGQ